MPLHPNSVGLDTQTELQVAHSTDYEQLQGQGSCFTLLSSAMNHECTKQMLPIITDFHEH